jgi:hypothetical protein
MARQSAISKPAPASSKVADRLAEVPPQGPGQEAPVLNNEGVVEPHGLAKAPDIVGGRLWGQQHKGGIAGEIEDEEHDE